MGEDTQQEGTMAPTTTTTTPMSALVWRSLGEIFLNIFGNAYEVNCFDCNSWKLPHRARIQNCSLF